MPAELLEREEDLARIEELLDAARRGRGSLLLLSGSAGIGKSRLLDACAAAAQARSMSVLRVRGDEVVMESAFAAVRELLWDGVDEAGAGVWSGAAELARPVFETAGDDAGERDRVAGVLHGLYWLVGNLAERRPLAMLVDDAHWLDAASARFVLYLSRRIESLALLLAAALRPGEAADDTALGAELGAMADRVLVPDPLSEEASTLLIREALGPRADEELCRSCHQATGGNPFYLRELTAALLEQPGRPTVEAARRLRSLGTGAIGRNVLLRLTRLGDDCLQLAQAVAILGSETPLRRAAQLVGLERRAAEVAADALRAADLLADGRMLSFVHPIVHEAVAAELPPSRRAGLHAAAARLLADEHEPADIVAAHLLSADPYGEPWVVDALRAAARRALANGAPEAAVSYLQRALAEPPDPRARFTVLVELGRAEVLLPKEHDFAALRQALDMAAGARERTEIATELALALFAVMRNMDAQQILLELLEREPDLDRDLVERIDTLLIFSQSDDLASTRLASERAGPYLEAAMRGELSDPRTLSALANVAAVTGGSALQAAELARRALSDERLLTRWLDNGYVTACWALAGSGELIEAAEAIERGLAEAQRHGSAPMFLQLCLLCSEVGLRAGDLDKAEDYCQRGLEVARELGSDQWARTVLARILVERDRGQEALALLEGVQPQPLTYNGAIMLANCGIVRVAGGQRERGLADMLDADARASDAGADLSADLVWVPFAASALVAVGRRLQATELAARELTSAVAFGSAARYGVALSVSGTLDDGEQGLACLTEGVAALERTPARLEHARALVNLGAGLRARGQRDRAREALAHGLEIAHRCGGMALADRAHAELVATGARPRRFERSGPGALTPAELRTAGMAAAGFSNREIAQALFVSPKTVEAQLSQAYAKLSIRSRAELAAALKH